MEKILTEDETYEKVIKQIIATQVLGWNCENVQDLAEIVTRIMEISSDMKNVNYGIDLLAGIRPTSIINIPMLERIYRNAEMDKLQSITSIWAIDKKHDCYYLDDGSIVNLELDVIRWMLD